MKTVPVELNDEQIRQLKQVSKKHEKWRVRERARMILLLEGGLTCQEVAQQLEVNVRLVGFARKRWRSEGLEGLSDRKRCGAPTKLRPEHIECLSEWAREKPLTISALSALHEAAGGPAVHANTLSRALKKANFVWKRTRHSLKKKRNPERFKQAQEEIAILRTQAEAGEIELAYLDGVGFEPIHPNRSAWTPCGQQHLIPAVRGKRLNVMGALLSSGKIFSTKIWQTFDGGLFVDFLNSLHKFVSKPLTIILDNASIHKAKKYEPQIKLLQTMGVNLYFLPPYSPELNRIEKFWHLMKHKWMSVKHRDGTTLEADVQHIFDNFGTLYKMQF